MAPRGAESGVSQVLHASLPFFFEDEEADEWLHVFEKVKQHLFHALVARRSSMSL